MKKIDPPALFRSFSQTLFICILLISFFQSKCFSETLVSPKISQELPLKITFKDFFNFPIGPKGVEFSHKVISLVGQTIVIDGYMVKSDSIHKGQFLLAPAPTVINEDDDGPANDLPVDTILVKLDQSQSDLLLAQRDGLLRMQGRLELGREEDDDGQVSWIRLLLSPQAVNILSADYKASHFSTPDS
jgi:hypothetical protein